MGPQVQTFSAQPVECPAPPLLGLQWNLFLHCVHVNVSNNKDLQHEKQYKKKKKRSASWRQLLEVGWKQRGQDVRSLSTSLRLLPCFAGFRLRGANGPNSHWLCQSVSAV